MSQKFFFIIFFLSNIGLVFVYIHKQNWIIKLNYLQQKHEKRIAILEEEYKKKLHDLHVHKDRTRIKSIAQNQLALEKISLHSVYHLEESMCIK